MKCSDCGEELIVFGDIFLHPPSACSGGKDGYELRLIDSFLRDKFLEKYGRPTKKINFGGIKKLGQKLYLTYLKGKREDLPRKK